MCGCEYEGCRKAAKDDRDICDVNCVGGVLGPLDVCDVWVGGVDVWVGGVDEERRDKFLSWDGGDDDGNGGVGLRELGGVGGEPETTS